MAKSKESKVEETPKEAGVDPRKEEVKLLHKQDRQRVEAVEKTLFAGRAKVREVQERNLSRRYPVVRDIIKERDRLRDELAKLKKGK